MFQLRPQLKHWSLVNCNVILGHRAYGVRPKFHALDHVVRALAFDAENPRCWECWSEESLGGFVSAVTRRCHSATAMIRAVERFIGSVLSDL